MPKRAKMTPEEKKKRKAVQRRASKLRNADKVKQQSREHYLRRKALYHIGREAMIMAAAQASLLPPPGTESSVNKGVVLLEPPAILQ